MSVGRERVRSMDVQHARPLHWWQRVVPMTALALVAGVVAVSALGGQDQIELSTSRQPQEYVELVLTRDPDTVCRPRVARVEFAVISHLQSAERLTWQVEVVPSSGVREPVRRRGSVPVPPGVTRGVEVRVPASRDAYDVSVNLPGRPELLRVHCEGSRR